MSDDFDDDFGDIGASERGYDSAGTGRPGGPGAQHHDGDGAHAPTGLDFHTRLLREIIDFTLRSLGSLPCAIVFAVLVFMLDTTLRSASAKLYFVCGFFIELIFFYTFTLITFPKAASASASDDGASDGPHDTADTKRSRDYLLQLVPFQQNTSASFYNFSVGYLLGYWGNLNIQKNTTNATLVNSYYAAIVFFCFTFSVFYLKACSWQSGVVSTAFGIVGGMIWSQIVMHRITLDGAYDDQLVLDDVGRPNARTPTTLPHGVTACDGKNDDMVCKVFRTGS